MMRGYNFLLTLLALWTVTLTDAALKGNDSCTNVYHIAQFQQHVQDLHQTKPCCQNESNAASGKFIEDIKKQFGALQTTVQNQEAKIEALTKEVSSLKKDTDWVTVFHASSGIQKSVYGLWTGPQSMYESGWSGNLSRPEQKADSHYKSYLVEQWQQLKIMQVRLQMFAAGKQVVNILFNGFNTNKLNWFSLNNAISSTWNDFPSGPKQQCGVGCYVSIKGYDRQNTRRRFYVNKGFNSCPGDTGWVVIIDGGNPNVPCSKDHLKPWPVFLYSKHHTVGLYGDLGNFGHADTMIIQIKMY